MVFLDNIFYIGYSLAFIYYFYGYSFGLVKELWLYIVWIGKNFYLNNYLDNFLKRKIILLKKLKVILNWFFGGR